MKAVIVSSSYSNEERIELLKEYYESTGYETTVLLTNFKHSSKTFVDEKKSGYEYINTKAYYKNISIDRLYSHHRFAEDAYLKLEGMQIDLLHVLVPANSLAKTARRYKEKHPNVRLFIDIIDLWPETMPISRFKKSLPFRLWGNVRDKNLFNADIVFCECNLFRKVLNKENDSRFKVLYWAKKTEALESTPCLENNELSLCYLGSINNIIDIEYIADMCKACATITPTALHIIGGGEREGELLEKIAQTGVKIVHHGVIYDPKEKQKVFDKCHFGLNVMKSTVCVGLTMKSLDYFQAGLPIINNIKGDTWDLVETHKIGFNGYQKLIMEYHKLSKEDFETMRNNVKKMYLEKFTKESFFSELQRTFDSK